MQSTNTDHRGRPVKLYGPPTGGSALLRDQGDLRYDEKRRIEIRLTGKNNRQRRLVVVGSLIAIPVTLGLLVGVPIAGDRIADAAGLSMDDLYDAGVYVLVGGIIVLVLLFLLGKRTSHESPVVKAFLLEGRCPSCAYDLKGVRRAADRLAQCPECGAAWRMPRRYFAAN